MIRGGVVMLNVSDVGRSVRFYIETLGMKLVTSLPSGDQIIDAGDGFHIGLRKGPTPSGANDQPSLIFYPKVPIDDVIAIFENRGIAFTKIDRSGGNVVACFKDDDGNLLALSSAVQSAG